MWNNRFSRRGGAVKIPCSGQHAITHPGQPEWKQGPRESSRLLSRNTLGCSAQAVIVAFVIPQWTFRLTVLSGFTTPRSAHFNAVVLRKVNHFTSPQPRKPQCIFQEINIGQASVVITGSSEHSVCAKEVLPLLGRPMRLQ